MVTTSTSTLVLCGESVKLAYRAISSHAKCNRRRAVETLKVKTNKSDFIDAEAIAEAVARPTMRFVPIKTDDQLDLQSLHRVRERWVMRRTAVINQIRGLLLERDLSERIRNILRRVSKSLRPENLSQFDRAEMQECLLALEQMKMLMSELEILHLLRE